MRVAGQLPRHLYVWIDSAFTHEKPIGFIRACWYGLVSIPARMWGCTVLLESGAIYRGLPPHAIAFDPKPEKLWTAADAQYWDCYGEEFSTIEYEALKTTRIMARAGRKEETGQYLFSALPIGDGYSQFPEQAKEFTFVQLDNGRLTIQPTNHVLFFDKSFTTNREQVFPSDLRRQVEIYRCE